MLIIGQLPYREQDVPLVNPQKNKGDAYERSIIDYLRQCGFRVDRTRAGWSDDRGDIHGIEGVTLECKNHIRMALSGWIAELLTECENNQTTIGAVIHKKKGVTNPADQYATLPLGKFVQLLREAGYK